MDFKSQFFFQESFEPLNHEGFVLGEKIPVCKARLEVPLLSQCKLVNDKNFRKIYVLCRNIDPYVGSYPVENHCDDISGTSLKFNPSVHHEGIFYPGERKVCNRFFSRSESPNDEVFYKNMLQRSSFNSQDTFTLRSSTLTKPGDTDSQLRTEKAKSNFGCHQFVSSTANSSNFSLTSENEVLVHYATKDQYGVVVSHKETTTNTTTTVAPTSTKHKPQNLISVKKHQVFYNQLLPFKQFTHQYIRSRSLL